MTDIDDLVKLSGTVNASKSGPPLPGAIVTAKKDKEFIQTQTGDGGTFAFYVKKGKWTISAKADQYLKPEAFYYNFQSDTDGIDFDLQEGYSITGKVISEVDEGPEAGVVMQAASPDDKKVPPIRAVSGLDGKFVLTNLPNAGDWKVTGNKNERYISPKTVNVKSKDVNTGLIFAREMTRADRQKGSRFFVILMLLLAGLVWLYISLHQKYPAAKEQELTGIATQVDQVGKVADTVIAEANAVQDETSTDETVSPNVQLLRSSLASLKETWTSVSGEIYSLSGNQKKQVDLLIASAVTSAEVDKPQEVKLILASILSVLQKEHPIYLWSDSPWTYLEVLFWSLAGILTYELIMVGYYLRMKKFIGSTIWMRTSQLVVVPVMALAVVLFLSILKLNIQIENSDVAINLDDPRLLAAISFIISVTPWGVYDYIVNASETILRPIKDKGGAATAGKASSTTSENAEPPQDEGTTDEEATPEGAENSDNLKKVVAPVKAKTKPENKDAKSPSVKANTKPENKDANPSK